ncbi:hypothetical protein [Sinosporangium siamense]|uniref:Uncharacterized protein n=1 Tax=Sinosporangium siamense TaxID=1367973 RepID=A0A919RJQ5_9ACTN|nr:hypothetical protein [Sinosporangium siamense]GII95053.1 hypothetical protein Ssi02_52840 [Sinosporangium siamense]
MHFLSRRHLLGTGTLAAAALLSPPSTSTPGREEPDVDLIVDDVSGIAFQGPAEARPGYVTFRASTPPSGVRRLRDVTLLRMREGTTIERYVEHIRMAFDSDPATRKAGLTGVFTLAHAYGGAVISGTSRMTFTTRLRPGVHYLLDFEDAAHPEFLSRIRTLTVAGRPRRREHDREGDTVVIYERDGAGRFLSRPRLRKGGRIVVVNRAPQPQEMVLVPVRPGTTAQDLAAYYEALKRGERPESLYIRGPMGTAPLSPGETVEIDLGVSPGEYALASFLSDADTMRPSAWEGTWKLVRVGR